MQYVDVEELLKLIERTRQEQEKLSIEAQSNRQSVKVHEHDSHCAFCDYLTEAIRSLPIKEEAIE